MAISLASEEFREFDGPRIGVPGRLMHETIRHIPDCFDQFRMRVSERQAHHSRAQVIVGIPINIEELNAGASFKYNSRFEPPPQDILFVTRHQVLMAVGKIEGVIHLPIPRIRFELLAIT